MGELLPCPFCGGVRLSVLGRTIECESCGGSGPERHRLDTVADSIRQWNRRASPQPSAEAAHERMSDADREWLRGMSVSVDVSTDDESAGHRYFGTVTEVMDDGSKHGVILLVQDAKPNFEPAPVPAGAVSDGIGSGSDGWNPIETAPLRDAVIVYHAAHWTRLACLYENGAWRPWPSDPSADDLAYRPTHWAHILPAPSSPASIASHPAQAIAAEAAKSVPEEWQLVPKVATDEMIEAAEQREDDEPPPPEDEPT